MGDAFRKQVITALKLKPVSSSVVNLKSKDLPTYAVYVYSSVPKATICVSGEVSDEDVTHYNEYYFASLVDATTVKVPRVGDINIFFDTDNIGNMVTDTIQRVGKTVFKRVAHGSKEKSIPVKTLGYLLNS